MCFRRFITFFSLYFFSFVISANVEKDSLILASNKISFFTAENYLNFDSLLFLESRLSNFHDYYNYSTIGNNGLPVNRLVYFQKDPKKLSFNFSKDHYSEYYSSSQQLLYFNSFENIQHFGLQPPLNV